MAIVPCDGSDLAEVATLLLSLARERGIDTSAIRVVWEGFEVPDELLAPEDHAVLVAPDPVAGTPVQIHEEPEARPETEPAIEPKRRGRPPGSKNAPKLGDQTGSHRDADQSGPR